SWRLSSTLGRVESVPHGAAVVKHHRQVTAGVFPGGREKRSFIAKESNCSYSIKIRSVPVGATRPTHAPSVHFSDRPAISPPKEVRMPVWKVLLIVLLGGICLALGLGTVVVPFSMAEGTERWLWFAGLLAGTLVMGTLFTLFLVHEDRKFTVSGR